MIKINEKSTTFTHLLLVCSKILWTSVNKTKEINKNCYLEVLRSQESYKVVKRRSLFVFSISPKIKEKSLEFKIVFQEIAINSSLD